MDHFNHPITSIGMIKVLFALNSPLWFAKTCMTQTDFLPERIAKHFFERGDDILGPSKRKKDRGKEIVVAAFWECRSCGKVRRRPENGG